MYIEPKSTKCTFIGSHLSDNLSTFISECMLGFNTIKLLHLTRMKKYLSDRTIGEIGLHFNVFSIYIYLHIKSFNTSVMACLQLDTHKRWKSQLISMPKTPRMPVILRVIAFPEGSVMAWFQLKSTAKNEVPIRNDYIFSMQIWNGWEKTFLHISSNRKSNYVV